jgi:serine/threonine protein phosphatase 1
MFKSIKNLIRADSSGKGQPAVPDGERYYVIGDIHGCCELFEALADAIDADDKAAKLQDPDTQDTCVVLLGDLVDRGPDSAGVIKKARKWGATRNLRYLAGNHEEMFLDSFADLDMLRHFVKHGGRETIMSYGISKQDYRDLTLEELQVELVNLVPSKDRKFLESFEEIIVAGDYAFVHAGIDPAKPIEEQKRKDMLWIRERFLRNTAPLSHVIVHGHTIFEEVQDCGNRIGIDTGAFRTGILTALVLEGEGRRYIQALRDEGSNDGPIQIIKTEELT